MTSSIAYIFFPDFDHFINFFNTRCFINPRQVQPLSLVRRFPKWPDLFNFSFDGSWHEALGSSWAVWEAKEPSCLLPSGSRQSCGLVWWCRNSKKGTWRSLRSFLDRFRSKQPVFGRYISVYTGIYSPVTTLQEMNIHGHFCKKAKGNHNYWKSKWKDFILIK